MEVSAFDPEVYVQQAAALINLPLQPEHQPGVVENLARIQAVAAVVIEFPLPADIEPAPIFQP